jgi:hypothetical protein
VRSGYAVITPDANAAAPAATVTFGILSNGVVQAQMSMTPTPPLTDGSLFADIMPSIGRNLGIAVVNTNSTASSITLTLTDTSGSVVVPAVTLPIAPQQQVSRFLNEVFASGDTSLVGAVRLQTAAAVNVLGLSFSGAQFSTAPVAVSTAGTSNVTVVPQFALGGGWATQIALVNTSARTISGRIALFDPAGQPMAVKLNGSTQSTFTYSIAAGGVFVLTPRDSNGQSPF